MKRTITHLIAICLLIASVLCLLPAMEMPASAAVTPYISFTTTGTQQPVVDMWLPFKTFKSGGPFTVTFEVKVENIKKISNPSTGETWPEAFVTTYVEGTKYGTTTKQSVEGQDNGATAGNYASQGAGWKSKSFTFDNVGTINVSGQDKEGNLFRTYFLFTAGTVYIRNVLITNASGSVVYNMNTDSDLTTLLSQMQSNGQTESDISNVASINPDCLWCAPANFGFTGDYYATVHLDDGSQSETTTKKPLVITTKPSTAKPTTAAPTTAAPTTVKPTTAAPTTVKPTTAAPTTVKPTTAAPTTVKPTTAAPTTVAPTTAAPTTATPTTAAPTTAAPTTAAPTTAAPTTAAPTTAAPTTAAPTTAAPTTAAPTTAAPTTAKPATVKPTTKKPTTKKPVTVAPTVAAPTSVELTSDRTNYAPGETVNFLFTCDSSSATMKLWLFKPDGTKDMYENLQDFHSLVLNEPGTYTATVMASNSSGSAQSNSVTFTVVAPTQAPTTAAPTTAPTQAPTTATPTTQPAPQPAPQQAGLPTWALILIIALTAGMAVTVTLLVVKSKKSN